jgi:hypothetical protein
VVSLLSRPSDLDDIFNHPPTRTNNHDDADYGRGQFKGGGDAGIHEVMKPGGRVAPSDEESATHPIPAHKYGLFA